MSGFQHKTGQYITIENAKIYYEETGNKEGEVVVLLHGGFSNIEDLNSITPALADKYRIIGIDSRGQGKSTLGHPTLNYQLMQEDTEAVLKELDIDEVTVIGFSDGGIIGYRMAISSNVRIKKLITIGAPWCVDDVRATQEIFDRKTPESWKNEFPETYETYMRLNPEPDFDKANKAILGLWQDESDINYPNEKVKEINCPVLLVRGDQDQLFSRKSIVQLADLVKNSHLLNIPNAGHAAHEDQKEIFLIALKQFLESSDTNSI
jgi:pimeloyl-ACP methyl ester carboxylesterase